MDDSDRDALRAFLHKIGQSVPENVDSNHAGYVRGLMGCVKAEKLPSLNDCSSERTPESSSVERQFSYSYGPPLANCWVEDSFYEV